MTVSKPVHDTRGSKVFPWLVAVIDLPLIQHYRFRSEQDALAGAAKLRAGLDPNNHQGKS